VVRSSLAHSTQPSDSLSAWGRIARATGGLGDRTAFREAWDTCYDLLQSTSAAERAAEVLLDMALGAASLGMWDKAEQAAREALETGSRRSEGRIRLTAEAVLDSVRHHRAVETHKAAVRPEVVEAGENLAAAFVRSLQSGMATV
jgi:HEAT repeat protein